MLFFDEKTAEVVGLSFGDGSLTRRLSGKDKGRFRFQLRGDTTEDREHYDSYVKPLLDQNIGKVNFVTSRGKTPCYGIYSERKEICKRLSNLGIPIGVKKELIIPEWIKNNSRNAQAFLRGYFDTDGSVFCGKDYNYPEKRHIKIRISFVSTSFLLLSEVSRILKNLGVHNLMIRKYRPKDPSHQVFYKIQVDGPNVKDFFSIIGSQNPKHLTKYEVWRQFGFCPPHTKLVQRKRMLIGKLKPEDFYSS